LKTDSISILLDNQDATEIIKYFKKNKKSKPEKEFIKLFCKKVSSGVSYENEIQLFSRILNEYFTVN